MSADRTGKIEERIREIAARFIENESNKTAMITITRVELYSRGKRATIYVSVLPVSSEVSALNFLKRKRKALKQVATKELGIHPVPFFDIVIDTGEKARQTIETLLREA